MIFILYRRGDRKTAQSKDLPKAVDSADLPTHYVPVGYDNTSDDLPGYNHLQAGVGYDQLPAGIGYDNLPAPALYDDLRVVYDNVQAGMGNKNKPAGPLYDNREALYDNREDLTTFGAKVHYDHIQGDTNAPAASVGGAYAPIDSSLYSFIMGNLEFGDQPPPLVNSSYAPADSSFYSFSNPAYTGMCLWIVVILIETFNLYVSRRRYTLIILGNLELGDQPRPPLVNPSSGAYAPADSSFYTLYDGNMAHAVIFSPFSPTEICMSRHAV